MKSAITAGLCGVLLLAGCAAKEGESPSALAGAAPVESHATTRQVMLGLVIPASDFVFQAGDKVPDDLGWDRLVANALMLAEAGELLQTGTRDLKQPEWTQFSRAMIDAAKEVAVAAQTREVDPVLEAGNTLYASCEGCHAKYMPARQGEAAPQ
jgi:hypothetical protein